ncbi:MAG: hypothetical protein C5B49_02555 [Bdellovibrio sp.]|nr:MAG: hypothetical protein C5B49_02555 [Bdellovibrio sp.]
MYLPKHFSMEDDSKVRDLIASNGFVTALSFPDNTSPYINHFPVMFSQTPSQENVIVGHMAKKNPQWTHFQNNPNCILIVTGPHTYITPRWYKSGRDVPTWNYAVAHLHGKIELVEAFTEQVEILRQLSSFYERPGPKQWEFELPDDLLDEATLTAAIISFRFHIESIEAKFKLSQNRPEIDRQGIIEGLRERTDDLSRSIRELMIESE